jgi:hypothetical protein
MDSWVDTVVDIWNSCCHTSALLLHWTLCLQQRNENSKRSSKTDNRKTIASSQFSQIKETQGILGTFKYMNKSSRTLSPSKFSLQTKNKKK